MQAEPVNVAKQPTASSEPKEEAKQKKQRNKQEKAEKLPIVEKKGKNAGIMKFVKTTILEN